MGLFARQFALGFDSERVYEKSLMLAHKKRDEKMDRFRRQPRSFAVSEIAKLSQGAVLLWRNNFG